MALASSLSLTRDSRRTAFACSVAAHGVVEATPADLAVLREQPGSCPAHPIPPRFLRYADEQTVTALATVLRAIDSHALGHTCFDDWGVLAAPQFLGRVLGAATMANFRRTFQAAVSPHFIPQHSLHSVSGAISIALRMCGPNFGVGGGPEALAEGLTVALTFLEQSAVPGLWLVLTQWSPEPVPNAQGSVANESVCRGVAMALVPGVHSDCVLRLAGQSIARPLAMSRSSDESTLTELARFLAIPPGARQRSQWSCPVPGGGTIELTLQEQRQLKAA